MGIGQQPDCMLGVEPPLETLGKPLQRINGDVV